ncbi:hypothetical protein I551_5532 [Mycobacterium ulcerans str. Harvey]|uniref:DUF2344 domain-containing protein n=1 Tax=Mycobacterium ulcerans str. Harvey TaxID=1299332 RepID=A0ABP3AAP7_MYCUL|nr:hypothetical protein I551_5532 [Mycobacterium ulcerans str. Harvey]
MSAQSLKLTAYLGERHRVVGTNRFLTDAMLDLFGNRGIATSVMLRGTTGFGLKHELRSDQSLSLSEDPPVTVVAVDVESKIRSLVDEVTAMTGRALLTLERARLVTRNNGVEALNDIEQQTADAAKLTVYVGRQVRVGGSPPPMPSASCYGSMDLPGPRYFLVWTAQQMANDSGPAFLAAMSTFRS